MKKQVKPEKCNCGKRVVGIVRLKSGLKLCPDCLQYCVMLKNKLKYEPENGSVIYGTKIEGVITKKLLLRIKETIKDDTVLNNMGSQNPPLFEILWECKSAEDAIKHGYTKHLWYRCKMVSKTIVSMNYLVNVDVIVGPLEQVEEKDESFRNSLNKSIDMDRLLSHMTV